MNQQSFHKMLGRFLRHQNLRFWMLECLWVVLVIVIAWSTFTWNKESVFYGGTVYFADGDCYARMTRVRELESSGLHPIRFHSFENHPYGTVPHTTMPLDALILGMSEVLAFFTGGDSGLELAGAWISPVLGILLCGVLMGWGMALRLPYRHAMALMLAASPILAHGFQLGRPDHQSLLVLLVGIGLAAEVALRRRGGAVWSYGAAVAWALAIWVSLFEPLVILGVVLLWRGAEWIVARQRGLPATLFSPGPVALFCAIVAVALLIDGRAPAPLDPAFARWTQNIGELRSPGWAVLFSWCGWLLPAIPLALAWQRFRSHDESGGFLALLIVVLLGLSAIHSRWGYFLSLAVAIGLPFALAAFRRPLVAWTTFIVSLWPVAAAWEESWFPSPTLQASRIEHLTDAVALRDVALFLKSEPDGGVVAPWWLSPAVVWWSNKPCVSGSSHQSLPGTLDTCRFYLSESPEEARSILQDRQAPYVITYAPDRVTSNAAQILGRSASPLSLVTRLHKTPHVLPEFFQPLYGNRFFNVHRAHFQDLAQPE